MNSEPPVPENDANLSGLGRALLESKEGSKPSGPWVPPTAEELGKLLPEYDIVKMLGRGGMGAVYMGRQKSLDRPVAIKILSNTLDEADASFAERFKNEARAMGKLNHPGIVAVHDFGQTASGLLYIVMEYVEGTDVARMIAKEGRLHTEHAMAIAAHVCDALAYAHDRGIIHRDIKPANIMVGYDGVVKVADFGLAKMTHSQNTGLTQSGMAMGTLHYMAPEALMLGTAVDHRADIYAVGVMLYQMLTGKIPQGMFKLPSLQIPGLDPRYDGIIAKGIMEDREARYQSVGEMRRDLDGILTQPVVKVEAEVSQAPAALPTMARPQRPGGQPYRPPQPAAHLQPMPKSSSGWLVWAVLGVLVFGGGYYWLTSQPSSMGTSSEMTATSPKPVPPNPFEAVDPPDQPMPPAPVASVQPAAAMPPPTASVPSPAPSAPAFDLQQLPDFRIRIANYQKARHAKLSDLTTRYRAALTDAQSSAPADALAYTSALTQAAALMTEIEKNLTATEVKPLSSLAATTGPVPQRLKELRDIFEKETIKLETGLATDLDQSLSVVQTSLAQAGSLDAANAVAAYRQQLSAVTFIMAGAKGASGQPTQVIPADAFAYGTSRYAYFSGVFPWAEAQSRAKTLGGHLVTFNTQAEEISVEAQLRARFGSASKSFWIGAILDNQAGSWRWINDEAFTYARWGQREPNNASATGERGSPPFVVACHINQAANNGWHDFSESQVAWQKIITGYLVEWENVLPTAQSAPVVPAAAASPVVSPASATKDKPFVNSLGMQFVPVPGTKVLMCVHETRYRDYAAHAADSHAGHGAWKDQNLEGVAITERSEDHPVVNVDWNDAQRFCSWLNGKEPGLTYRLPTDLEWSFGVGLDRFTHDDGTTPVMRYRKDPSVYPWDGGFPPRSSGKAGNYADAVWQEKHPEKPGIEGYTDGYPTTAPVMSFKPNKLGLYDMGGNVWEWCEDWFDDAQNERVLRGASWDYSEIRILLSSYRARNIPRARFHNRGFRVVLELP